MASVVCTAGEEPALVLAKFLSELAWADAGEEVAQPAVAQSVVEAGSLLAANRSKDLLNLLLLTSDTVLPKTSPQDLECVLSLLINLVPNAGSAADVEEAASKVAAKVMAAPADVAPLKLKLLFLLHNVLPASNPARFLVLLSILGCASDAKLGDAVLPNLRRMELQRQDWWPSLDISKKRSLYSALTTLLRDHLKGKGQKEVSVFSLKYLALFTLEEAQEHSDVREAAATAALDFLRSPHVFESDLLDVAAVHALEKDPKHSKLYELLHIFLASRLPQFTAFKEANPTALQTLGLTNEECETKMRLLSLASAAARSLSAAAAAAASGASASNPASAAAVGAPPSSAAAPGVGEIRYAVLQEMLQVKDELEVENWVVKAISAGLVDAKMDQMRQTVIVSRASYRVFGTQQWQELRSRLLNWKENVASVSKVTHQAGGAAATGTAQGTALVV